MNTDRSQATVSENKQSKIPARGFIPTGEENAQNKAAACKETVTGGLTHTLLFHDSDFIPPVSIGLATNIGLKRAIILQKLASLIDAGKGWRMRDGRYWIRGPYDSLINNYFPFMDKKTFGKHIIALEKSGLLESCQPESVVSRTKYFRVNTVAMELASREMAK